MSIFRRTIASTAIAGLTLIGSANVATAEPTELHSSIASIENRLTQDELHRLQNLSPAESEKLDIIGGLSGPTFTGSSQSGV